MDVVDALQDHFKKEPDIIIWFDCFSESQHFERQKFPAPGDQEIKKLTSAEEEKKKIEHRGNFIVWRDSFNEAIKQIGRTVMVMAPWDSPMPLKRSW